MTKEQLFEALNELDDDKLEKAAAFEKPKGRPAWVRWGALAACLCLLVGGAAIAGRTLFRAPDAGGGAGPDGAVSGGAWPEGIDPVAASVAVFPATEKLEDVADAALKDVTEEEALASALGAHLPDALPEGYRYRSGGLYETVMKNGARHTMLRVTYRTGDAADMIPGDGFLLWLTDFDWGTKDPVYPLDDLPAQLPQGSFHVDLGGGIYTGVEPLGISDDELVTALRSMQ
ncbi:MAG: hypothetical protein IK136_04685 [Oscillospiraceae bacterium]|nr:hypothetical protein [Oscillospiraceae bacterium]